MSKCCLNCDKWKKIHECPIKFVNSSGKVDWSGKWNIEKHYCSDYIEMQYDLKPCPFCNSSRISVSGSVGGAYYVKCNNCNSQTGIAEFKDTVVSRWNNREESE